jgi:hypothetical protein
LEKEVWNRRSKKDLVERFREKYRLSIKKLLVYIGLSESSYYYSDKPNGRKGIMPLKQANHKKLGVVEESAVIESIRKHFGHEFMDCHIQMYTAIPSRYRLLRSSTKDYFVFCLSSGYNGIVIFL